MPDVLGRNFYARSPIIVARELVGKTLVRRLDDGSSLEGVIVETEAYGGNRDPASHAFRGKTKRNEVMFGEAGHAYIYFTYGFHHCLNFVTGKEGVASAVLIRAVKPTIGIQKMMKFRGKPETLNLTNGPGKLCQAFNIDLNLNGIDVTTAKSALYLLDGVVDVGVNRSSRIGINSGKEKQWRFFTTSESIG